MEPRQDHFPVFEANQVLTSRHLNDVFTHLDEQERLTRANLIGIGIVCGVEVGLAGGGSPVIQVSKGCGVTSQGYLIDVPEDLQLTSFRAGYKVENQYDAGSAVDPAAPFAVPNSNPPTQYALWELFAAGEPDTLPLGGTPGFLDDKAVLLLLELKQQGLRNCSPNNCDDKGSEVTATVKPLLIERADLTRIIAAANNLSTNMTASDLAAALLEKWKLPELRLPRFDVPSSGPVETADIYAAFLEVFRGGKLAASVAEALHAAYKAFQPLLKDAYPTDPFTGFEAKFGFLDRAPAKVEQVRFLQYYYDLFDDVLRAYDEFRWKGAELACACCPPEDLFPRHLMLGLLHPEKANAPGVYRQAFLSSRADCCCGERVEEVIQLFRRLVEMTIRFTDAPALPKAVGKPKIDPQIRITPSLLGNDPLGSRAIPYYYTFDGAPPLYELWSPEKSRRHSACQNLGYRSDEYVPAAPAFVTAPLRHDLEPYDFLRIEGHLGKNYQQVLGTLLSLREKYRLPVEVVALRSGKYDDAQAIDLNKESARFQDLEALYDVLREELLATLTEGVRYLYGILIADANLPSSPPKHPLLTKYAPNYRHPSNSVGAWYESYFDRFQAMPYLDVDQDRIDSNAVLIAYCVLFNGTVVPPEENYAHVVSIYYFTKLAETLPGALDALAFEAFRNKYEDLLSLVRYFRSEAAARIAPDLQVFAPREDLIDHFDQVLYACKLEPVQALHDEYVRRLRELRKKQFLAYFLQSHPGIQHKAGVPLGGTFLVIYHQEAAPIEASPAKASSGSFVRKIKLGQPLEASKLTDAIRIGLKNILADKDIVLVLDALKNQMAVSGLPPAAPKPGGPAAEVITAAIAELQDGTVIADFYLPYRISADWAGVQFVLPKVPLSFGVDVGCANADGFAPVAVKAKGGVPPYEIDIDGQGYDLLTEPLGLQAGEHTLTIRDVEGTASAPQTVKIAPIEIGEPVYECSSDLATYTARIAISGGSPPYTVNGTAVDGDAYTTEPIESGTTSVVEVVDTKQCSARIEVAHTCVKPCTLPCSGTAQRRGYRFWLPEPGRETPYTSREFKVFFSVEIAPGKTVDLSVEVEDILRAAEIRDLNQSFAKVVDTWLGEINAIVAGKAGEANWFELTYEPPTFGSLGTLWIERFVCLGFEIRISSIFSRPELSETWVFTYSPEGTDIFQKNADVQQRIKIPAFDGVELDKCQPEPVEVLLCANTPDIMLMITPKVRGQIAYLNVEASGNDSPVVYLWEVQDAIPPMASSQEANSPKFEFTSEGNKGVCVTAFTSEGCSVKLQTQVTVAPHEG